MGRGFTTRAGPRTQGGASTPGAGPSYLGGEGVLGPRGAPQALLLPPLSFLQIIPLRQPEKKTRRCCPSPPTTPPPRLFQPFHLYDRANQWRTRVYCLFHARAAAPPPLHPPPPTITEMFLPISAFTYHFFPGDIELPMPRPPRHICELAQLLFIPTNNLVMKY